MTEAPRPPATGTASEPGAAGDGAAREEAARDETGRRVRELRLLLEAFTPRSGREEASLCRTLDALGELERPFDREAAPVHATGSALVWGTRGTVMVLHKRLRIWVQPGGHIDPGEGPADAALREAGEETGLRLHHPAGGPQLLHVDVHPAAEGHVHLDMTYLLLCEDSSDPAPGPGESPEVKWVTLDEATALADESLADGLARLRGLEAQPGMPP